MSTPGQGAFLSALHHRIADRIALPWARAWLHAHAHLELGERHGWPVLVLVLEEEDPDPHLQTPALLLRHYKGAAINGKASGPLSDLAVSLEVAMEAGQ